MFLFLREKRDEMFLSLFFPTIKVIDAVISMMAKNFFRDKYSLPHATVKLHNAL